VLFDSDDQRHCDPRTVQVFHVTLHFSVLLTRTGGDLSSNALVGPAGPCLAGVQCWPLGLLDQPCILCWLRRNFFSEQQLSTVPEKYVSVSTTSVGFQQPAPVMGSKFSLSASRDCLPEASV